MKGVHYYPKGILCWFEANQYGDPIGSVYLIKRVPDERLLSIPYKERGYRQLLQKKSVKGNLKKSITKERSDTDTIIVIKPKLSKEKKGVKRNASGKDNRKAGCK